ncbi:hemerythrin domain-containing protein [Hydrogenophaga sp.]|jgi:hemerythrin-like domain-containing protein|uniref:hemerythrin domain-containing protein n=1 Tax=Hydrogenophaga sp. TaxID=1904254 RepID=UPI003F71A117
MPMQPIAIQLIVEEHRAIANVLHVLQAVVDDARRGIAAPDFERLRAVLVYLDEMPARVHHASEGGLLFPLIRERCPALRPVLARLEAEHERVERIVRELGHALSAWQVMGEGRHEAFELLARTYVEMYLGHMKVEEGYVLPVAMDYLDEADWQKLAVAFEHQRGEQAQAALRKHRELYERIVAKPSVN